MISKTTIRPAETGDMAQLIELCAAHAAFEKSAYDPIGKKEALQKELLGATPKLYCLVAIQASKLVGYATFMEQYSTWDAAHYIYMDCLFLTEATRGHGIGEQLIRKIQEAGKKTGCNHIQWQTPTFNTRAMKFYKRIGATSKSKARFFLDI